MEVFPDGLHVRLRTRPCLLGDPGGCSVPLSTRAIASRNAPWAARRLVLDSTACGAILPVPLLGRRAALRVQQQEEDNYAPVDGDGDGDDQLALVRQVSRPLLYSNSGDRVLYPTSIIRQVPDHIPRPAPQPIWIEVNMSRLLRPSRRWPRNEEMKIFRCDFSKLGQPIGSIKKQESWEA